MPRILQEIGTDGQHIAAAEPTRLEQDIYGVVEGAVGGKGALLTKKRKKNNRKKALKLMNKSRHFECLAMIFCQKFDWLQEIDLRFLLQVWMWPVSHDSCGIIYLQKRAASFRNIRQRWDSGRKVVYDCDCDSNR